MSLSEQTQDKANASSTRKTCYGQHAGGQRADLITTVDCMICPDEGECIEKTMKGFTS